MGIRLQLSNPPVESKAVSEVTYDGEWEVRSDKPLKEEKMNSEQPALCDLRFSPVCWWWNNAGSTGVVGRQRADGDKSGR